MVITRMAKPTVLAFATTFIFTSAGSAFAATEWNATHPRRAEVNQRLSNQNATINRDRANGASAVGCRLSAVGCRLSAVGYLQ